MFCCGWFAARPKPSPSLMLLRRDELRAVMSYLDYVSIVALARCCRDAFAAANTRSAWSANQPPIPIEMHVLGQLVNRKLEPHIRQPSEIELHPRPPPAYGANDHDSSLGAHPPDFSSVVPGMTTAQTRRLGTDLCLLQYVDFELDVVGDRRTTVRQFLFNHVEPKCRRRCELDKETGPCSGCNIPPPPKSALADVNEMVQLLDWLKEIEFDGAASPTLHSNKLVAISSSFESASSSVQLTQLGSRSALATRLHRLRYRGIGVELTKWRPVLSHSSLQHLSAIELHASLPNSRPIDDRIVTHLPMGILSLLTPQIRSQLTSLKLVHPHPDDTLADLTLMPQLTTLAIRGVCVASFDSIRHCTSLTHFRLLDGTRAYHYDGGTAALFLRDDSALRHIRSLYLGWNCWQPLESPWATWGHTDGFMDLDYHRLFVAFSLHLTNLTELELEGCLFTNCLMWQFDVDQYDRDVIRYGDWFNDLRVSPLGHSIDWSEYSHAGILSGCTSLRHLILHNADCSHELIRGILSTLPHLSITIYQLHPSIVDPWGRPHLVASYPSPRVTVRPHPAADRADYVSLHGNAF